MTVHAGAAPGPQRRTFTFLDDAGERTITVLGERIVPLRADPLPWDALGRARRDLPDRRRRRRGARRARGARARRDAARDGRAGGVGRAPRRARRQRRATPARRYEPGHARPRAARGRAHARREGGAWSRRAAARASLPWLPAGERAGAGRRRRCPGPPVDAYGCGDSFAAALAYGLGAGMELDDAIELGRALRGGRAVRARAVRRDARAEAGTVRRVWAADNALRDQAPPKPSGLALIAAPNPCEASLPGSPCQWLGVSTVAACQRAERSAKHSHRVLINEGPAQDAVSWTIRRHAWERAAGEIQRLLPPSAAGACVPGCGTRSGASPKASASSSYERRRASWSYVTVTTSSSSVP